MEKQPIRTAENGSANAVDGARPAMPNIGDWLWRPRRARTWWAAAVAFWGIILAFPGVARLGGDQIWPWYLMMLFHPFVIVPALGFGFVRAWIEWARKWGGEVDAEDMERSALSIRRPRLMDPMDPTDPRFMALPCNPSSEAWKDRHVRGLY